MIVSLAALALIAGQVATPSAAADTSGTSTVPAEKEKLVCKKVKSTGSRLPPTRFEGMACHQRR